jgi:hypothetical protein
MGAYVFLRHFSLIWADKKSFVYSNNGQAL